MATFTPLTDGQSGSAANFNAPLTQINTNVNTEEAARIANDATLTTNVGTLGSLTTTVKTSLVAALNEVDADLATEVAARIADVDAEGTARAAAIIAAVAAEAVLRTAADAAEATRAAAAESTEQAARLTADGTETTLRSLADGELNARIDAVTSNVVASNNPIFTTLLRQANAVAIASIGGDGATTTVHTSGAHGYADGDYVTISGTTSYNGNALTSDAGAGINVISTTEFRYLSAVNAATETTGYAATKGLYVGTTTGFVAGQAILVQNDTGLPHATTVSGTPAGGVIQLAAAVPTTWTGSAKASIGKSVSSTLLDNLLAYDPHNVGASLWLAESVRLAAGGAHHADRRVRSWGLGIDNRADLQATINDAQGHLTDKTIYLGAHDYRIRSQTGSGRSATSLLITGPVRFIGVPGLSRIMLDDGGLGKWMIVRTAENVTFENISFADVRTVKTGGNGASIENSSNITFRNCIFENFGQYGVGVFEDSSTYQYTASTIAFSSVGNTITDSANGFTGVAPGNRILIQGTLNNNGYKTVATAVAGTITTVEAIVTEAAGATDIYLSDNTISFEASTKTIKATEQAFDNFDEDNRVAVTGSASNNNTLTIDGVSSDGERVTVLETLVNEAAGATVVITKVARVTITVMNSASCNDIVIDGCKFYNIGKIGAELFPKTLSYNQQVTNNYFYNCGHGVNGGCAIKAGQAVVGAVVSGNIIELCNSGIQAVNWEDLIISSNVILSCDRFGIAITRGVHVKYPTPGYNSLKVDGNLLAYSKDRDTDLDFVSAYPTYSAININATITTGGPIEVTNNVLYKWPGGGLSVVRSVVGFPRYAARNNWIVDCGTSNTAMRTSTVTTTSGSPILTAVTNPANAALSTAGWRVGYEITGTGIPAGATIIAVNPSAHTITMSANATASGTITADSGLPSEPEYENNRFINTDLGVNRSFRPYGVRARVINNYLKGMGDYPMHLNGDGTLALGNRFVEINPLSTGNRGLFLLSAGAYSLYNNHYEPGNSGTIAYIANNTAATAVKLRGNTSGLSTVRPLLDMTIHLADTDGWDQVGPTRTFLGTAAPVAGGHWQGDQVRNRALVPGGETNWGVTTLGTPGTWWPLGYVGKQLPATATWDPASIAAGGFVSTTITVTGAAVGDFVLASLTTNTVAGVIIDAKVTSANTVTAMLFNPTGGAVDPGSGTLSVRVFKYA